MSEANRSAETNYTPWRAPLTLHETMRLARCRGTYACMDDPNVKDHDLDCPGYVRPSYRVSRPE